MILWFLACTAPIELEVATEPEAVIVAATQPMTRLAVLHDDLVIAQRRLQPPLDRVELPITWETGEHLVRAWVDGDVYEQGVIPPSSGLIVTVDAPLGQGSTTVADGAEIVFTHVLGTPVQVAVHAQGPGPLSIRAGHEISRKEDPRPGERLGVFLTVEEDREVVVESSHETMTLQLRPKSISGAQARAMLAIVDVAFPADSQGRPDPGRDPGRVTLPATWWRSSLKRLNLGTRTRGPHTPWTHQGVTLENTGTEALNVVIRSSILLDGQPDPGFSPRLREADDGTGRVSVLLRVPPGERARAALPVFVDSRQLLDIREGRVQRLEVSTLGAAETLVEWEAPLYISRGNAWASAGIVAATLIALVGLLTLLVRGPVWLRNARTSDLMTIALIGSLLFMTQVAGEIGGAALSAILGPFSGLITGLIDDALRFSLLAVLVTLLPRPGTAALATVTGALLAGLAMGRLGPLEAFTVCSRVAWIEGALWVVGITRNPSWRDGPAFARWLRLSLGFGAASVLSLATMLVLAVVLYRLFYADWYVALMLTGPGFLYVAVAMLFAAPFAHSLRKVAP